MTPKEKRELESRIFLEDVNYDAVNVYKEKEKEYSDSWRDFSVEKMFRKVTEEYQEIDKIIHFPYNRRDMLYQECLDLINVAKMLAYLVKEETGKVKEK